jgi:hypothetical protein
VSTAWLLGGRVVVDSLGRVLLCDQCPCVEEPPPPGDCVDWQAQFSSVSQTGSGVAWTAVDPTTLSIDLGPSEVSKTLRVAVEFGPSEVPLGTTITDIMVGVFVSTFGNTITPGPYWNWNVESVDVQLELDGSPTGIVKHYHPGFPGSFSENLTGGEPFWGQLLFNGLWGRSWTAAELQSPRIAFLVTVRMKDYSYGPTDPVNVLLYLGSLGFRWRLMTVNTCQAPQGLPTNVPCPVNRVLMPAHINVSIPGSPLSSFTADYNYYGITSTRFGHKVAMWEYLSEDLSSSTMFLLQWITTGGVANWVATFDYQYVDPPTPHYGISGSTPIGCYSPIIGDWPERFDYTIISPLVIAATGFDASGNVVTPTITITW